VIINESWSQRLKESGEGEEKKEGRKEKRGGGGAQEKEQIKNKRKEHYDIRHMWSCSERRMCPNMVTHRYRPLNSCSLNRLGHRM
jgi:hypothetical protein